MIAWLLMALLLVLGTLFFFIGTIALLRFPDVYTRMHAATKCDTLGLGLIMTGLMIHAGPTIASAKIAFIVIFVFITGSTSAHVLSRAIYKHGVKMWEGSVLDRYKDLNDGHP